MDGPKGRMYEQIATVDLLCAHLQRGIDVELVGLRGSGRTTAIQQVSSRLVDEGWLVLNVRPVRGRADAVSRALARHSDRSHRSGVTRTLSEFGLDRQLIVLIDDAAQLDSSEWLKLHLARQEKVIPVVTVHDQEDIRHRPGRELLGRHALAATVEMPILPIRDLRELIDARYDTRIDPRVLSRIYDKSGGHIGTAIAVIEMALAIGTLSPTLRGPVESGALWHPRLDVVLDRHLALLDADEHAAVALVAFAGTLDVRAAQKVAPLKTFSRLEARGILRSYGSEDAPWLALYPPLLAERFRGEAHSVRGFVTRERLTSAAVSLATTAPPSAEETSLGTADPFFLRLVSEKRRSEFATAQSRWEGDPSLSTALDLLDALNNRLAPREKIHEVLDAAMRMPADSSLRARLAVWRANWIAHAEGDLPAALHLLEDRDDLGDDGRLLDAASVSLSSGLDRIPPDALVRLADDPDLPREVRDALRLERAHTLLWQGAAGAAAVELDALAATPDAGLSHRASVLRGFVELSRGRFASAEGIVLAGCRRARDELDPAAMVEYLHLGALMLFAQGRQRTLNALAENLRSSVPFAHFPRTARLALLSVAATGDLASVELVAQLERETMSTHLPSGPLPGATMLWPRAHLATLGGDTTRAAELLWQASTEAHDRGYVVAAALSAIAALEIQPDPERLMALAALARDIHSPVLGAYVDYVGVLDGGDAQATAEAAGRLADIGWTGRAVAAYSLAARRAHAEGDGVLEAMLRQAGEALTKNPADTDLGAASIGLLAKLSLRERGVADLVADGLTNQEIADQLYISVRTVENHIHRAIRKVNVLTRTQLEIVVRAHRG